MTLITKSHDPPSKRGWQIPATQLLNLSGCSQRIKDHVAKFEA